MGKVLDNDSWAVNNGKRKNTKEKSPWPGQRDKGEHILISLGGHIKLSRSVLSTYRLGYLHQWHH